MDHIRDDPAGAHSVDALAEVAHSSPFHFHRLFKAVTGETVGNFVQRARLERAAYLMKAKPSKTLTSIAMETGFASSQEFSPHLQTSLRCRAESLGSSQSTGQPGG